MRPDDNLEECQTCGWVCYPWDRVAARSAMEPVCPMCGGRRFRDYVGGSDFDGFTDSSIVEDDDDAPDVVRGAE